MRALEFRHPRGVCPVWVGQRGSVEAAEALGLWARGRTVFVVSAEPVLEHVGARLEEALLGPGLSEARRRVELRVPDGEDAKRTEVAAGLWQQMLDEGGKRDSGVVAVGGGSVGDLGGFVAGTYMRGIDLVQVPTTLLAQVDASVGGKTAIDQPQAKNSVGVFHYPEHVFVDTGCVSTLPAGERRSGLAEVIKMAALLDHELLDRVEKSLDLLLAADAAALEPVVAASIAAKIRVVEEDPEEGGFRKVLNFGHTLAHAIEKALDFGTLRHGEAVGYGLLFALRLSLRHGLDAGFAQRLVALLERLELPPLPALEPDVLLEAMARDKKAREGGLVWVLARGDGEPNLTAEVPWDLVRSELDAYLASPWRLS